MNNLPTVPNAIACTEDFEFHALDEARNYRKALLREFAPYLRGNVLEVGAGIGQLTEDLRRSPAIEKLCAIEPSESFCEQIQRKFPDQLLVHGTVEDLKERSGWNAILSVNVLEHIEHDDEELRNYYSLLNGADGSLCLFVPARSEIYAPIDRDFGHFRRYTRSDLKSKLETAGFSITRIRYYNFVGYFAWWLNFRVLRKRSFEREAVRFYDRVIFPVVNWSETALIAPPIGQSLLVIAKAT
jgi:SAM-dependent methyltransferase